MSYFFPDKSVNFDAIRVLCILSAVIGSLEFIAALFLIKISYLDRYDKQGWWIEEIPFSGDLMQIIPDLLFPPLLFIAVCLLLVYTVKLFIIGFKSWSLEYIKKNNITRKLSYHFCIQLIIPGIFVWFLIRTVFSAVFVVVDPSEALFSSIVGSGLSCLILCGPAALVFLARYMTKSLIRNS